MPVGEEEAPHKKAVSASPDIECVYLLPTSKTMVEANRLAALFRKMELPTKIEPVPPTDVLGVMRVIVGILKKENRLVQRQITARRTSNKCIFETEGSKTRTSGVIINITGGTKPMAAAAMLTAYFTGAKVIYVYADKGRMSVIEIPTIGLIIDKLVSKQQLSVLCSISRMHAATPSKICKALGLSKQNVNYYIRLLESLDLVTRDNGFCRMTPSGEMLLLFQIGD